MTTDAVFEKILILGYFELYKGLSVQKAQESGKGEVKKSKNHDFFMKASDDRKTFLGPN